jgi:hypothetical protein
MKKSLVTLVVLASCLAFAGTVLAMDWACIETPTCKVDCKPTVFCKGKAKGAEKLCGPCAPTITWAGQWKYEAVCPKDEAAPAAKKVVKK